jgi:hypothetical protein
LEQIGFVDSVSSKLDLLFFIGLHPSCTTLLCFPSFPTLPVSLCSEHHAPVRGPHASSCEIHLSEHMPHMLVNTLRPPCLNCCYCLLIVSLCFCIFMHFFTFHVFLFSSFFAACLFYGFLSPCSLAL